MASQGAIRGNLVAVLCMLVWATSFPVTVMLLETWPPMLLTAERSLIGGLVIGVAALAMGQSGSFFVLMRSRPTIIASAALSFSGLLFVFGQKLIDPVAAAVIVSAMPIFSVTMGWIAGRERFTLQLGAAIALAVAGGIVTSLVSAAGSGHAPSLAGSLLALVGVIAYTWQTRIMVEKVHGVPDMAKGAVTMVMAGLMSAVVVAAYRLSGQGAPVPDVSFTSLALLAWLGGIAIGASTVWWYAAGRMIGVTVASMHHNMVPFYVIAMAALSGAAVTPQHIVGAGLVIAGAVLAQVRLGARFRARAAAS